MQENSQDIGGGRVGTEENEWEGWEMAYNDRKGTEIEVNRNEMK